MDRDPRVEADALHRMGILELAEQDRRGRWHLRALAALCIVAAALVAWAIVTR